jgi:hypothetical protein
MTRDEHRKSCIEAIARAMELGPVLPQGHKINLKRASRVYDKLVSLGYLTNPPEEKP